MMLNAAGSNSSSTLLGKIPLILQNAAAGFSSQLSVRAAAVLSRAGWCQGWVSVGAMVAMPFACG